ncbi:MAG: SulP family inorganic anion transporter [Candidatus Nanopelagicales bacterium]|nr:SulP family inorganic anion transporter [Candidatus Nanopelagicales bacterium]
MKLRTTRSGPRLPTGFTSLRTYERRHIRGDVFGGLTVTAYLIPQVMAYSALAGVAAQVGLWVVALTLVVYFFIGSSRLLSAGPESTTALLTAATLAPLALGDSAKYASLAAVLAVLCGVFAVIAWLLRLGFIGDALSKPVLVGYMAGVAVIMIMSQLGKITGIDISGDSFITDLRSFADNVSWDSLSWASVLMGVGVAVLLLVLSSRFARVPVTLVVIVLAAVITAVLDLEEHGVLTVGVITTDIPTPGFAGVTTSDVSALLLPALGVFIVAYTDNLLTGRMFGDRHHQQVDGNRELLALGATNIVAGVAHGFPVSSSASRASLGDAAGARTQVYSIVAAIGTLIVLFGFGGLLASFPLPALGGLVAYAAIRLIDIDEFRRLWGFRRREFALAVAATASVLLFDILWGVLFAVGLSVLELLTRVARPHAAVLGQVPDVPGWHDITDYTHTEQVPGLLVFRYDSPLFFANATDFVDKCEAALTAADPLPSWLLLNMEANVEVDITGLDALERLRSHCARLGVSLALVRVKHEIQEDLMRHGVGGRIGPDRIFPTLPTAVSAFRAEAGA